MLKGRNIRIPPIPILNSDIENYFYLGNPTYFEIFEKIGVLNEGIDREDLVKNVLGFVEFCRESISDNYIKSLIRDKKISILYARNSDGILLGACCFEYIEDFIYIHGICSLIKGKNIGLFLIEKLKESFELLKEFGFTSIKLKSQQSPGLKEWYKRMEFNEEETDTYKMI